MSQAMRTNPIGIIQRFSKRLLTATVVLLALGLALLVAWQWAKERYATPWIGAFIARQIEQRSSWQLTYRGISGNLLTNIRLHGVRLEPGDRARGTSDEHLPRLAIEADRAVAWYTPMDLLRGRLRRLETAGGRLILGETALRFEASGAGTLATIYCPPQTIPLEALRPFASVPETLRADGRIEVDGELVLKAYRPHLIHLRLNGHRLRLRWGEAFEGAADLRLALTGTASSPSLDATIRLTDGRWRSAAGAVPAGVGAPPLSDAAPWAAWADRFPGALRLRPDEEAAPSAWALRLRLASDDLRIRTAALRTTLRAALLLKKEPGEPARLIGTLQSLDGTYVVRERHFSIVTGYLTFPDEAGALPRLDALLETRIKRYRINAAVQGTVRDAYLRLSAEPELSREEIMALLMFGKRLDLLSDAERQQLGSHDLASQALDLLLLGRVELLAAEWLNVDEVNVHMTPPSEEAGAPLAVDAVEIGKYFIDERLFGSYQVAPAQAPGTTTEHTIGAEYRLTDRVTLGAEQTRSADPATPRKERAFIRFRWKF